MPVPKRRISTMRKGKRRAVISLKLPKLVKCSSCGEKKRPHTICKNCKKY